MKILKCECGREQSYGRGSMSRKEAKAVGWVVKSGEWICPFCNPALVRYNLEIFAQDNFGHKESWGKYQTSIENYTLCVDVRNRDFFCNTICLHIEFSGKVPNPTCLSHQSDKPT